VPPALTGADLGKFGVELVLFLVLVLSVIFQKSVAPHSSRKKRETERERERE
jgi:hypothetical protein